MNPLITLAHADDIPEILTFVMNARAGMFPMLDPDVMPDDLQRFQDIYLAAAAGRFLIARHEGQLVGAIGYLPYDGRFAQLDYSTHKTVEVVRLFVDPDSRRMGLAARLFDALKTVAREQGVEVLYLHTHPFLPGAISFWQRQGFVVVDIEEDPVWHTTHMHRSISA
jgi:GNAT superfamily N-acetyltransferase